MRQEAGALAGQAAGERKIVTVLFADIVNSTSIVTSHDPEEANAALLNTLHAACSCIRRYRGTVSQIMGDGVLAVFGAPVAQEDHALRAGLAARDIHAGIGSATRPLPMRIGLSSGEVVTYGSQGGVYPYIRVIGEPVHLAARLQERARPGATNMSEPTRAFLGARATTRNVGQYRLEGRAAAHIFELEHVRTSTPARGNTPVDQGFTTMIGRERELEVLECSARGATATRGESVLIRGDAGVGKSRLTDEFTAKQRGYGTTVYRCDFQPSEIAQLANSFRRLVRRLTQGIATASHKADPLEAAAIEAFIEGQDTQASSEWRNLEPIQRLDVTAKAVSDVITTASHGSSFVLVCEDIHHTDTITLRIITRLARHVAKGRVLLVCTQRTADRREIGSFTTTIDLEPLDEATVARLIDKALGTSPSLLELRDSLIRETQGNPLHLEECLAALVDSGALGELKRGGYYLHKPITEITIPNSVRGALAARIDQLDSVDRSILLHAAAIGRNVDVELLETITGRSRNAIAAHLSRLQERCLIRQSRIIPHVEYAFTHNLIQEVAYGTLLRRHRRQLHRSILAAISGRSAQQLPSKIELMADHAYRAERWTTAYLYSRRAASRAQAVSRNVEAKCYLSRAIHSAEALGSTRQNLRRLVATQLELVPSLVALGQHNEAREHLDECLAAARHINSPLLEAKAASDMALLHWIKADYASAVRADRQALRLAKQCNNRDQEVASAIRMGMMFCEAGNYLAAERLLRKGAGLIPGERTTERFGLLGVATVGARAYLARAHAELGLFQSAAMLGDESIRIADTVSDPFSRAFANIFTGLVFTRQGEYQRALLPLRIGAELSQRARLRLLLPLAQACLGYVKWHLNRDRGSARQLLESAVQLAAKQDLTTRMSLVLSWLAEVEADSDELGRALEHAHEALRISSDNREEGHKAWSLWTLALIAAKRRTGSYEDCLTHVTAAKRIAHRRNMKPLAAHCELSISRLMHQSGDTRRAIGHAVCAKAIYEDLGQKKRADCARQHLAELTSDRPAQNDTAMAYSAASS